MGLESAEIFMDLEDAFGISLMASVDEPIKTVRDLVDFVEKEVAYQRDHDSESYRKEVRHDIDLIFERYHGRRARERRLRMKFPYLIPDAEHPPILTKIGWRIVYPLITYGMFLLLTGSWWPAAGEWVALGTLAVANLLVMGVLYIVTWWTKRIPPEWMDPARLTDHIVDERFRYTRTAWCTREVLAANIEAIFTEHPDHRERQKILLKNYDHNLLGARLPYWLTILVWFMWPIFTWSLWRTIHGEWDMNLDHLGSIIGLTILSLIGTCILFVFLFRFKRIPDKFMSPKILVERIAAVRAVPSGEPGDWPRTVLEEIVTRVLMERLSATRDQIKPEARLIQDLGMD